MKLQEVVQTIDHTNVDPEATEQEIKQLCDEAKEYNFRGACVKPEWTSLVAEELEDTDIKVVVLLDEPMGQSSHEERVEMAKKATEDGADNLDIVMNIVDLKHEDYDKVLNDLSEIADIQDTKVIIGSGYLSDSEIKKASELVKESGAICVKTSTAKSPLGHWELKEKAKHLEIMKEASGLEVKAAGKIRHIEDWELMTNAGADIIGTSTGAQIAEEVNRDRSGE
ncbi:MAG: deoxyribose-phosphate aldolase [Candidatus Paceibacterota bacterium]